MVESFVVDTVRGDVDADKGFPVVGTFPSGFRGKAGR